MMTEASTASNFSSALRLATLEHHAAAARTPIMRALLAGTLHVQRYAHLLAQQFFVYEALEDACRVMANHHVAGQFVDGRLDRLPALQADLLYLLGPAWRDIVDPGDAAAPYCERIRDICFDWPGGFVAHHYVRYMGDLSGGQLIGLMARKAFGLPGNLGSMFYAFDKLDDLERYKQRYRDRLDDSAWPPDEQARIIQEALKAYDLNIHLLQAL